MHALALLLATRTLVFLATSDQHGHLEQAPRLARYFAEERKKAPGRVIALDGGDLFQGTLVSNLHEGAAMVQALNALGYSAAALGNHEFDYGPVGPHPTPKEASEDARGALKARVSELKFPMLSSNVLDEKTGRPMLRPWVIVTADGVKVGVVGGTAEDLFRTTNKMNLVGIKVVPLAPAVAAAARAARRAGASVVVAVVHAGGRCPKETTLTELSPPDYANCEVDSDAFKLARELAAHKDGGRVDAIFGGHTHQNVTAVVAGIPVLQAYDNARAFSKLELEIDGRGRPTGHFVVHAPQRVERDVAPEPAVEAVVKPALDEAESMRQKKVGVTLPAPLKRAYKAESPLGNFVADVIRANTRADVGMSNGGGLRADLPAGELSYGALFEALPFDNRLATVKMSGAELKRLLGSNLGHDRGILSISGVRARARCQGAALAIDLFGGDGAPIADDAELTVGTTDFLANGGDDFASVVSAHPPTFLESEPLRDVVAAFLARRVEAGKRTLAAAEWLDPAHPRINTSSPRPVSCAVSK